MTVSHLLGNMPAMAGPLTDDERQRIADLLHAGRSRAEIAAITGRGSSTIQRVAKAIGYTADEQRAAKTANAREARSAFCKERRAKIAARLTEEAELLLDQLHRPHTAFSFGGKDNDYNEHTFDEPDVVSKRTLIDAAGSAMRTVVAIDKHDNRDESDRAAVRQWLDAVIHGGNSE